MDDTHASFMETGWKVLGVFALVLLNGFFVAAELALVKVRDTQLDALIKKGHRRAAQTRRLVENLDSTISTTQLGITLASLGLGILVEPVFAAILGPVFGWLRISSPAVQHAIAITVGFLTNCFLLIVVGELAPKAIAIRKTVPVAVWTSQPLVWFQKLTGPFVWFLHHSAQWLLQRLGIAPSNHDAQGHSEEELRLLLAVSQGQAGASHFGRDIVLNALDLRRRTVRQVMRPRHEITVINTGASISECLDVAERTRYSRFPLCEEGDPDKTIGVVHFKDLFAMRLKARSGADLLPVARGVIYVPESAQLEKLLRLFLDRKLHLAIVVDEYGGTTGLATLENILEELVGQIQDEFDQEKPLCIKVGEQSWEVDGAWPLHELSELLGENLQSDDVTTSSGWITHHLGGFPKMGDTLAVGGFELRVETVDGARVAKLRVTRLDKPAAG
jgi:CBS domain containing-hemolysin-like protein